MTDGEKVRRILALNEEHRTKEGVFDGRVDDFMKTLAGILGR